MTRDPDGKVENPSVNADKQNSQNSLGLSKPAEEAIFNIKECIKDGDTSGAKRIYDTMNALGLFPDEITFESLSAEKKTAE
jgi:hypothetical protein